MRSITKINILGITILSAILMMFVFYVFANVAMADSGTNSLMGKLKNVGDKSGYVTANEDTQLAMTVGMVVGAFFALLGVIFIVYIIYAGYHWMTARGEEQKIKEAQATIRNAIIGLIITLGAYAIWDFIIYRLTNWGQ